MQNPAAILQIGVISSDWGAAAIDLLSIAVGVANDTFTCLEE